MIIALIIASWIGITVIFTLAIASVAAFRARHPADETVSFIEVAQAPDTSFALDVHAVPA